MRGNAAGQVKVLGDFRLLRYYEWFEDDLEGLSSINATCPATQFNSKSQIEFENYT